MTNGSTAAMADPGSADFATQLDKRIHEAVKFEEEKRFRQLKWITVVLGLIGVGTLGTIATFYVDRAIEARAGQLTDQAALFRFLAVASSMKDGSRLSDEERIGMFRLMRRLSENKELRDSPDVSQAVNEIFKRLVSIGDDATLEEVFALFERQIISSRRGIQAALHHYGQAMNSGIHTVAATMPNRDVERFERAERMASSRDAEELALSYRCLYQFAAAKYTFDASTETILTRIAGLNDDDRARFFNELLLRTRAANWQSRPTPNGIEFQRRARLFFTELRKRNGMPAPLADELERVAARGCDEERCPQIAKHLSAVHAPRVVAGATRP